MISCLLQDVRLQDIGNLAEAYAHLGSQQVWQRLSKLGQQQDVTIDALAGCLDTSLCINHVGIKDLTLADVERMALELQQQAVK